MKKVYISIAAIISFFVLANDLFSDGPPIKNGQLTVEHQKIHLNEEQINQAGRYRHIVLTDKQKRAISKSLNKKGKIQSLIYVITEPYLDCSCCLGDYGLWSKRDEVQISNYILSDKPYLELNKAKDLKTIIQEMSYSTLIIDANGEVYQKGIKVNNLNKAYKNYMDYNVKEKDEKYIFVETPPLERKKIKETVIKTYANIITFFEGKGFKVQSFIHFRYAKTELQKYYELPIYHSEKINKKIETYKNGCSLLCNTSWKVKASSHGTWKKYTYKVNQLNDYRLDTAWVEGVPGHGINETIELYNFENKETDTIKLNGMLMYNGYLKNKDLFEKNSRVRTLVLYYNEKPTSLLRLVDTMHAQKVSFPEIMMKKSDKITLKIIDIYGGFMYQDTAITLLLPYYGKL